MKVIYFLFLLLINFCVYCQNSPVVIAQIPREKVSLITDKSFYISGDSMTIEAQVVDARTLEADTLSIPLYVEMINNDIERIIQSWTLKLIKGKAVLKIRIPTNLTSNYYQLRAYTNWMKNFGEETFSANNILILGLNYQEAIPKVFSKSPLKTLSITPETGKCIAGLANNLYIETKDAFGVGVKSVVYLKSDTTTIRIFDTNDNGEALVEFTPKENQSYFIESGYLKADIPVAQPEGVLIRGYFVNGGKKLILIIQNNLNDDSPLRMLFQTRGEIHQSLQIQPHKKNITLHFESSNSPEGILNIGIINQKGEILSERAFLIAHQNKTQKENYLLFNAELDKPLEGNREFFSELPQINVELISRKNILYSFNKIQKIDTNTNFYFPYKNELGICITGKLDTTLSLKAKQSNSISLVIVPLKPNTENEKMIVTTLSDKEGRFSFDNLDFYGESELSLKAFSGKKYLKIFLDKNTTPTIVNLKKNIDWETFMDSTKKAMIIKGVEKIKTRLSTEIDSTSKILDETTVTSVNIPYTSLFRGEPSERFIAQQIAYSGTGFEFITFIRNRIAYRLAKHLSPVVKCYVDDFPTTLEQLANVYTDNDIAYVDVYDNSPETSLVNASILLNVYTKGYIINPLVRKIMALKKEEAVTVIHNGYHSSN
jgi:hypothetical protein